MERKKATNAFVVTNNVDDDRSRVDSGSYYETF